MKPAKKHTDGSKNRQQTNENNSTSKIKAYFKSAEKSFVIEGVGGAGEKVKTDTVKDFYVKALKEKLKGEHFWLIFFLSEDQPAPCPL